MWGRVPRDWEMGRIGPRAGCGFRGGKQGIVYRRRDWEGISARDEGGATAQERRGRRPAFSSPPRAHEIFHSPPGPQPAPGGPHKAALCWEGGRAPG